MNNSNIGWIIAAIVALLFLRRGSSLTASVTSNALGSSSQDTTNTPANQPAPWDNLCGVQSSPINNPPSSSLPMMPVFTSRYVYSSQQQQPVSNTRPRVTFGTL